MQEKTLEGITKEYQGFSKRYKREINTNEEIKVEATMASSGKEELGAEDFRCLKILGKGSFGHVYLV